MKSILDPRLADIKSLYEEKQYLEVKNTCGLLMNYFLLTQDGSPEDLESICLYYLCATKKFGKENVTDYSLLRDASLLGLQFSLEKQNATLSFRFFLHANSASRTEEEKNEVAQLGEVLGQQL